MVLLTATVATISCKLLQYGMEEQIIQMEMKISYMEDTIATLNSLVIQQRKEIDNLSALIERLEARLTEGEENPQEVSIQRPPHY